MHHKALQHTMTMGNGTQKCLYNREQVLCLMCRRHRVLLGASGSVAAIKVVQLAHLLAEFAEIKLVLTKAAKHFVQQDDLPFKIHGMACSFVIM